MIIDKTEYGVRLGNAVRTTIQERAVTNRLGLRLGLKLVGLSVI